jgi:thiol-disulfide isomerase/thioredoxin
MIKQFFAYLFLSCVVLGTATAQDLARVNGISTQSPLAEVVLSKIEDGRIQRIAGSVPASDGSFGFLFKPEYEGLYLLGNQNNAGLARTYQFYFKRNDVLNIELKQNEYALTGKNTKENIALTEWYQQLLPLVKKNAGREGNSTYVDYFPDVEAVAAKMKQAKATKTGNKAFDAFFPVIQKYDLANQATSFIMSPRSAHPSAEELSNYYTGLQVKDFLSTTSILKFPYSDRLIFGLIYTTNMGKGPMDFNAMVQNIPNDTLKGQYAMSRMESSKSYVELKEKEEKYATFFALPSQQKRLAALKVKLAETKPGKEAANFSYADASGKNNALQDFKGKLVMVDVWATWCVPCKAEEPHWKKLNEEYAGKNIVFMGISVDKDKAAWEKYVKEKTLKGLQLHAGPDADISTIYKIDGIPRYMLFDKQGKIITIDSPRPSDPLLTKIIDEWLVK